MNSSRTRAQPRPFPLMLVIGFWVVSAVFLFSSHARATDTDQNGITKSHAVAIFGEPKYTADFAHFDYVNAEAPKGGVFSTWAFGTFDSLTPYILKGNAAIGSTLFYDSLLVGNLEESGVAYGLVAHTIEQPDSLEWVIFHMRPEARFRDGSPVTAHDVVFSYTALIENGRPVYATTFRDFESVEALDDHRVKFTFDPAGPLRELVLTAGGIPIFSKDYYAARAFDESSLEPPMGSGPYSLGTVVPGRSVTYLRRDDYWAKDLPVNVGSNNFDELRYEYFADYTAAFEAFKGGAYFYREEFSSRVWATSYGFPAVDAGHVFVGSLPDGRPAGTQGFWFNMRRDKFKDPRVREAIGLAFNFEWSNESLFYGLYQRTDSFWENSSTLQANGLPGAEELALLEPLRADIPETVFTEPAFTPAVSSPDALADRRALRRATRLLNEAGWEVGEDGFRYKDGERLFVDFLNDSASFERILNPFVQNLQRLGIDANTQRIDSAESQEREKNFDFDIVTQRFSMSQTPGDELASIFGSQTANTPGSPNIAGIESPAIDSLITSITSAQTKEELEHAVRALDRVLRSMHVWVPQWYKAEHNIAFLDVFSRPYSDNPPPLGLGATSIWWWDEEKADRLRAAGAL